jgi:hypothetical protein
MFFVVYRTRTNIGNEFTNNVDGDRGLPLLKVRTIQGDSPSVKHSLSQKTIYFFKFFFFQNVRSMLFLNYIFV